MSEVEYRNIPSFPKYRAGSDGTIWNKSKKLKLVKPKDQDVLKVILRKDNKPKHC